MPDSAKSDTRTRIGDRLRHHRTEAGISLSELARRAGVGKGTLSQIEAGNRNPTVETLYALTGPLGIPMSALIGEAEVRIDAAGGMQSTLLDVRHLAGRVTEVFRLEFPPGATHESPAHPSGVSEQIMVVDGAVTVGPISSPQTVELGQSHQWAADVPHRYATTDGAVAILLITTPEPN